MRADTVAAAIVGGQTVSRAGMKKLVEDDPGVQVMASVSSAAHLNRTFDVIVLDLTTFAQPTLDLIREVAQFGPALVCSTWHQPPTLLNAIRTGTRGCMTYHTSPTVITDAVRTVARGGFYLCSTLVDQFQAELSRPSGQDAGGLAPREVETLRWIAEGLTHTQIATRMRVSPATINTYAKRIRAKLKAGNKAELTRMAIELGHLPREHTASTAA